MDVASVPLHTSPLEVAWDATLSTPRGTRTFTPGEPSVGVVPCPRSESVVRAAKVVPVLVLLALTAPLSAR
jgi:hypothetical protein